jgi:hypothetical protein
MELTPEPAPIIEVVDWFPSEGRGTASQVKFCPGLRIRTLPVLQEY